MTGMNLDIEICSRGRENWEDKFALNLGGKIPRLFKGAAKSARRCDESVIGCFRALMISSMRARISSDGGGREKETAFSVDHDGAYNCK